MMNLLTIELQAINLNKNVLRQYNIHISKDLFGSWLLTTLYGRVGKTSRLKTYAYNNTEDLGHKFIYILKKRINAKQRIGTNYQITRYSVSESGDIPQNISEITRFFLKI